MLLEHGLFAGGLVDDGQDRRQRACRASDCAAGHGNRVHGAARHFVCGDRAGRARVRTARRHRGTTRWHSRDGSRHRLSGDDGDLLSLPRAIRLPLLFLGDAGSQATVAVASTLLLVGAAFFVVDGLQTIAAGSLRGFNDTFVPFLFAAFGFWVVGFVSAWLLAFNIGWSAAGIWIGLSIGLAVYASLLVWRFKILDRPRPPARNVFIGTAMTEQLSDLPSRSSRRWHRRWPGRADLCALYPARRNGRDPAVAGPS